MGVGVAAHVILMSSKFQINSSILFLTYPRCDHAKEDLFQFFLGYLKPKALEVVVAREQHKDGCNHLHAVVKWDEAYRTRNPNEFDFRGAHCNVQPARSYKNVLKYCTKEDNFIANFDIASLLILKKPEKERLGARILAGEDVIEIIKENPKFLFGYTKLKTDIEEYKKDSEEIPDLPAELPNPWGKNMQVDTDIKRCHYWVYSKEPNRGKTTAFILPLLESFKACLYDPRSTYHTIQTRTKMVLMDELVERAIPFNVLNKMCDGTFEYKVIYKGDLRLLEKPLIVICSNFSIDEVFKSNSKYIHARFNEINVD